MYCQLSEDFYFHVEALNECPDILHVRDVCKEFLGSLGIPIVKYAWIPPAVGAAQQKILFFSWPHVQLERSDAQWYLASDPKIRYCQSNTRPITWSAPIRDHAEPQPPDVDEEDSVARSFWEDASSARVDYGITIPIRGLGASTGMFFVATEKAAIPHETVPLPLLEAWAMHVQNRVEQLYADQQLTKPLTSREREVLQWTMLGKTADETGLILRISENTVLFHLRNLRSKLDVSNKYHMIARALSLRLV